MAKQTITIIGTEESLAQALAHRISQQPYRLLLMNSLQGQPEQLVNEILLADPAADVEAVSCAVDCSWEADIIVLAVPHPADHAMAAKIKMVANQKIVISISEKCDYADLQQLLPHSKLVRLTVHDEQKQELIITGTDTEAVETVKALIVSVGFDAVSPPYHNHTQNTVQ